MLPSMKTASRKEAESIAGRARRIACRSAGTSHAARGAPTQARLRPAIRRAGAWLLLTWLLPSPSWGFSEDLCVTNGALVNCLSAEHCSQASEDTTLCRANATFDALKVTLLENGRSTLHTDATYFIAAALGLRADVAYFLAAYDQATDLGQYVPFDMQGAQMTEETRWHTALINGWQRTNAITGGLSYHYVTVYKRGPNGPAGYAIDGQHPRLDDPVHEGLLHHLRTWAMNGKGAQPPCADGFTEPEAGASLFTGSLCYHDDPSHSVKYLRGLVPAFTSIDVLIPFGAHSGRQIAQYEGTANQVDQVSYYAEDLSALLRSSTGRIGEQGSLEPVPAPVARLGIYLHVLQDRLSHYQCGDASYVGGPNRNERFVFHYDEAECTQDKHAWRHFEEIGWPELPERTISALEYTYDEIAAFASLQAERHPEWLTGAAPKAKAELIRDEQGTYGIVAAALAVEDGCERARAFITALDDAGLPQMPGNDAASAGSMCPTQP